MFSTGVFGSRGGFGSGERIAQQRPVTKCPRIHLALRNNSLQEVQRLIEYHEPNLSIFFDRDPLTGSFPLHIVCERGYIEIALYLLRYCSKCYCCCSQQQKALDAPGSQALSLLDDFGFEGLDEETIKDLPHPLAVLFSGKTPLAIAVEKGNIPLIQLLFSHGADINQRVRIGKHGMITPLHCAVLMPNAASTIRALVKMNGIDVNARSESGATPLFLAVQATRVDYVQILYENGGDLNITPNGECLLAGVSVPVQPAPAFSVQRPLPYQSQTREEVVVKQIFRDLLTLAEPSVPPTRRLNLFSREESTNTNILHFLIGRSIDVTELIYSIMRIADRVEPPLTEEHENHPHTVGRLLRGGGRLLTAKERLQGNTPLMKAAEVYYQSKEPFNTILKLESQQPFINIENRMSSTPLYSLCASVTGTSLVGHLEGIKLLISYGADVSIVTFFGESPLAAAVLVGCNQKDMRLLNFLLDSGADVNEVNPCDGKSLGHVALLSSNAGADVISGVFECLLSEGLDPNARNNEGSLLHIAAAHGNYALLELLLQVCIASVVTAEHNGIGRRTAAHVFKFPGTRLGLGRTANSTNPPSPISNPFELLKAKGLDLNALDAEGKTALHIAVEDKDVARVEALTSAGCDVSIKSRAGETALEIAQRLQNEPPPLHIYATAAPEAVIDRVRKAIMDGIVAALEAAIK